MALSLSRASFFVVGFDSSEGQRKPAITWGTDEQKQNLWLASHPEITSLDLSLSILEDNQDVGAQRSSRDLLSSPSCSGNAWVSPAAFAVFPWLAKPLAWTPEGEACLLTLTVSDSRKTTCQLDERDCEARNSDGKQQGENVNALLLGAIQHMDSAGACVTCR